MGGEGARSSPFPEALHGMPGGGAGVAMTMDFPIVEGLQAQRNCPWD